jgi:hypothetical protein
MLRAARDRLGVHIWPGYCGGPEAATVWPAGAWQAIRGEGLRAPVIYVGLGNGNEAATQAANRGLPHGEVVWHDIETGYSMSRMNPDFASGWVAAVRSAGYLAGLYGTASFANQWASRYDCLWVAGGPWYRNGPGGTLPARVDQVPGMWLTRRPGGCQYWGTHDEPGVGTVDRSIMDGAFASLELGGEDVMTLAHARDHVFLWYMAVARRHTPPQQPEIDSWASRLAAGENGEKVFTDFLATPEVQAAIR